MNQWNKEESPKLNPGIHGYLIYYKGSTTKPRVFSINGDGQVDNKWRENMDPTSLTTKINSRCYHIKGKIIKFLEENVFIMI